MEESLKESKMSHNLNVARDGVEAHKFLRRQGPYSGSVEPDIILLDLNMPKKDGMEVLLEVKEDP
jgi:two-component system response regulator